ncbi:MAG: rhomboid family intramembrane serine protease [bacterium]|nr:rhomboid family intramembrane serine protease [bacterium]
MLSITCSCGKRVDLAPAHLGKAVGCPTCQRAVRLVTAEVRGSIPAPVGMLMVWKGPARVGEQIFLAGGIPLDVGKLPGSDIRLVGNQISRTHCRLVPTGDRWSIEDEASTNGLYVNGRKVDQFELHHGDRVRVGDYELKYVNLAHRPRAKTAPPRAEPIAPPSRAPVNRDESPAPAVQTTRRPNKESPKERPDDAIYAIAGEEDWGDDIQALAAAGEVVEVAPLDEASSAPLPAAPGVEVADGECPVCPCCDQRLAPRARICVACGINVKTGRSILTAQDSNPDEMYVTAEGLIRWLSWIFPTGIYPIASEAFGGKKPYAVRALTIITIVISAWFLAYEWSDSPRMRTMKNLMLWSGEGEPTAEEIFVFYYFTNYGDGEAFQEKLLDLGEDWEEDEDVADDAGDNVLLAAHHALPPEQQYQGQYRHSQLITHAFLHGGVLHLAGNLVFLLVLGSRVNALIGNTLTLLLYPILAVGAALAQMASVANDAPRPMLGASGAIMGLAGMYFVLFPVHKVHMAAWIRWIFFGFRLALKMWPVRGFWVVLFYIASDVIYTAIGVEDGTAHWAHLGGFIVGAAIALILLATRLLYGRGGDLISAILGKYAWPLVGRPNREPGILHRLP